jgi:hypothetical protein
VGKLSDVGKLSEKDCGKVFLQAFVEILHEVSRKNIT